MNLTSIQSALRDRGMDGWLFTDHHGRDPLAYRILGLVGTGMSSRRWWYYVPANGAPTRLAHRVEPRKLDALPGTLEHYHAWTELHAKLKAILAGAKRVAMQYSPNNDIPYIGLIDAGTIELIRSFGPEVVSSADLVQQFEAVVGDEGLASHAAAGVIVQKIKDEAFAMMARALKDGTRLTEYDVKEHIVQRFAEEGLTCEGESPIVGFRDHPADPHFEPTVANAYELKRDVPVLVDLWARRDDPPGIYYDITWCAWAGANPPDKYVDIFDTVRRARDAAFHFVRQRLDAGTPTRGCDVDDVARKVVRDAGYGDYFLHRTGHSIGTTVHGNGANIDNLETKDERLIVPGTCFSIEPGIYLAGSMGVRSEFDVFVTPKGRAEVLGPVQDELILLA